MYLAAVEERTQEIVVWLLFELEIPSVGQIVLKGSYSNSQAEVKRSHGGG